MSISFCIDNMIQIELKLSLENAKLKYDQEYVY